MKSQHLGNSTARKVRPAGFQRSVLASACVVALGSFAIAPAMAQSVYTLTFPGTQVLTPGVSNSQFISNSQNAQGNISSTGSSLGVAVTSTGSLIGGTPVTVNANSIYAGAFGNIVDPNSIDLFLAQSMLGSVGILSGQSRAFSSGNPVFTRAVISGGTSGILENGALPATKTVSGNSITAQTQLNTANNIIAGQVPVAFTSIAPASVALTYTGVAVSSTVAGPVQIGNFQSSFNAGGRAGSIATVDASTVTLDLQATAGSTASSPLTLTNNAIAANYGGNDATSRFTASAGGGTVLQGGVAVSNAQGNIETTGAGSDPTAYISNSTIKADITSRTAPLTSLSAPLVVSNNSLSATSSGNTAGSRSATGTVAGNSITIAPGVDLVGNGGSGVAMLAVSGTPVSLSGDAVLSSSQANQGTYFTSQVQGTAITPLQNGVVTVRADTIAPGGSINAADNSVNAAATGNFASNLVTANNANLTGSVAAGNLQINDATPITGTVNFGSVTANAGSSAGPVSGAITSNKNTISASAEGNVAATSVALTSSNLTSLAAPAGASSATANANGLGSSVVTAGTSAANLQSNSGGGAIGSTVFNSFVAVNVNDQVTPANLVGLNGASVSATNNAITSDATGNNAATSIALAGTNGAVQSAVGNTQLNGSAISGRNLESGVIIRSADVATSAVTLTGNTVSSAGTANNATNALTATGFANLTVGPNAIAASSAASAAADVATNNAALGIASAQRNTASVSSLTQNTTSAAAGGGFATVYAGQPTGGSGITGSNVQASNNTVSATTTGNRVANTVGLGGSTLDTVGNSATRIAAIANSQINDVTGVANATVDGGSTAVTAAGVTSFQAISNSNIIASANQLNATSLGNRATNSLVSGALGGGGGVTSLPPGVAAGTAGVSGGAAAEQEFAVVNSQTDTALGGRTALVQLSTVGVSNGPGSSGGVTNISGSTITADGNRIVAEARNNDTANSAALTGLTTLGSSIGVANYQSSTTAVNALVNDSGVQVQAVGAAGVGAVSNSNLTVSNNVVQGLAVGSSAQNSLTAGASTLSGNSGISASGVSSLPTPRVVADYALANNQIQSGAVTSAVSASNRVILAVPGVGSDVTGGALVLSGNTTAADAQATSAVNNLALAATGSATGLTGAVGSFQTSSGAVSATLAGEAGSAGVANITARSLTNTSATAAGNLARASAGQNEAFNTQNVSGATVAGSALAASTDFSVVNTQQGAGNVSSTANPGLVGVAANGVDTTSVTVSGNAVRSSASVNTGGNALGISATGTVAATGGISNSQTATTGVVSATQGSSVTPTNIGLVQESVSVPIIIIGGSQVTVTGNTVAVQASRNSITNQQVVTGATIAGGTGANGGLTQSFSTANSQVGNGNVTASSTLGTVGAVVERSLGSNLTVAANRASAAANVNSATNNQTMAATSTLTGSGFVLNSQTSGLSAFDSVSATLDTATVGLAPANALTVFVGGTIAVTGNQLSATAGRNGANNALVATAATVGSASVPASFGATNSQSAGGDVSASNTVGTIGATANLASGNSFSITGNSASAVATSNVATTAVTLGATSGVYASATANNSQTAVGGVLSAAVNSTTVGLRGVALDSTPVTVSGNVLNAEATRNSGTNALTAAAPTVAGGAASPASFAVISNQTGQGNVTTNNAVGVVGATQNSAIGGTFSVSDNSVLSSANVNKVANSLVLNAANGLSGTGLIDNNQTAQANSLVSATASGGSIGVTPFTSGNTLVSTPVTVSGNVIAAQGGGNTALNAIETVAVNTISGSFPSFPTYGLLNAQNNAATVTTTVRDFRVGLVAAAVTTTASSVVNNQASALSYGNTASNAVAVSALTGSSNLASTLINNTQTNSASISSAVTGVNIGVSGGSLSNGSVVVSGNAISARSVGNSASNIISQK